MRYLLVYLLSVNIVAFMMYYVDKMKAIHHQYRISEMTLLFIAFIGGSFGAMIAMHVFHHKTQKFKFRFLIPLLCILDLFLVAYIL